jgi:hypothetical protein
MLKYCLLIFSLLFILKCNIKTELFNPEYTPEISVFGIISTDGSQECVVVERTLYLNEDDSMDDSGQNPEVNPIIDDAIVQIISEHDTVQLTFYKKAPDSLYSPDKYIYKGMYLDTRDEFKAQAGESYTLQVKVPDGRTVTGVTTVPTLPTISIPNSNALFNKKTINETRIEWLDDANTTAYIIQFYVTIVKDEYGYFLFKTHNLIEDNITYDPPATLKDIDDSFFNIPGIQLSDTATIKLLALDKNIYDYASKSSMATLTGTDLNLVEGGVGVFGSISSDSVKVILQ